MSDRRKAAPLMPDEEAAYRSITDLLPHQTRRVWATLDAARAALAATPEPTLDAERLAEAIRIVTHDNDPESDDADNLAAALAAEYARLHERTEP